MHPLLLTISIGNCITLAVVRAAVIAGIGQIIGYVGGTHISEDERNSRADGLVSAGAHQVVERMCDLIGILSAIPVSRHGASGDRLMPLVRMVKNGVAEYQEFSAIERFTL